MAICEYCDSHLEDGITTCPHCGAIVAYVEPKTEEPVSDVMPETEVFEETQQEETGTLQDIWEDLTGNLGRTAASIGGAALLGSLFGKKSRREPLHTPHPERRPVPDSGIHSRAGRPGGPGLQRGGFKGNSGGGHRGGMGGGPRGGMGGPGGRR